MSFDAQPWVENGNAIRLTQDQWIEKYNQAGKVMAAAPDFYMAVKEGDDGFISGLRDDFNNWLALDTRLNYYNPDSLETKIIHYFGSTVVDPVEFDLVVPIFRDIPIEDAIVTGEDAEKGLAYLQAYFGTSDSAQDIIQVLEKVSGKDKNRIKIWTAKNDGNYTRASHPDVAAFVGFDYVDFNINGYDNLNNVGRSRGVGAGGAWLAPDTVEIEQDSPYDIQSGIYRKAHAVHFSNTQQINGIEKYTGMFCFQNERYVVSLSRKDGKKIDDKKIAGVLAKAESSEMALTDLQQFNPLYAHIARYQDGNLVDDLELFGGLRK